jgi:hypothetical protein
VDEEEGEEEEGETLDKISVSYYSIIKQAVLMEKRKGGGTRQ